MDERGFNAYQTHRNMYPSIFNPVIQPVSSKVRNFSMASPGIIAVNVTWTERGFNVGQMDSSIYPSIFILQPFMSYSEILVGNGNFFLPPPLHLTPSLGCSHWNSGKKFGPQKTRIMGLPDSLTIGWAVLTQYQRMMDGQSGTDGRTDVQPISITCAVWLTHVKN